MGRGGTVKPAELARAGSPYGGGTLAALRLAALVVLAWAWLTTLSSGGGGAETADTVLGIAIGVVVVVIWATTPEIGRHPLAWLAWVPGLDWFLSLTAWGILCALVFAVGVDVSPTAPAAETRAIAVLLFGIWVLRVAARVRPRGPRRSGLVAAATMIGGPFVTGVAAQAPDAARWVTGLGAIAPALAMVLLAVWLWRLGGYLHGRVPGRAFALPGIDPALLPENPRRAGRGTDAAPGDGRRPPPRPRSIPVPAAFVPQDVRSPVRFGVGELAARTGLDPVTLAAHVPAYRTVRVAKRSGTGVRELRVPDAETKRLQRLLLRRLIDRIPAHPAANGFERGRSIVTNARPHVGRPVVVKMDIVDFFGSTSARRVRRLFRVLGWDAETARLLTTLLTDGGRLPQGAPTSPRLANVVNVRMDARLAGLAERLGARYTRYADDLTFSFETDDHAALADLIGATRRIVRDEGYTLHTGRKLQIRRRHHRQTVTGLVVNDRVALPRARRRWLRAVEHHRLTGRPTTITEDQLTGWQAFELMVEGAGSPPQPPPPPGP